MKITCSSLCFTKHPFEYACEQISKLGFKYIDIGVMQNWAHFNSSDLVKDLKGNISKAQDTLGKYNLTPVAFNSSSGSSELQEERERVKAICDFAQALSVKVICYSAPSNKKPIEPEIERIRPLTEIAKTRQVQFSLEAHTHTLLEIPEVAARFCQEIEGLKITLDPSHMYGGPNQGKLFDILFPLAAHTHVRDARYSWPEVQVPFFEGVVDFTYFLKGLHKCGYKGALSHEYIDSFNDVDCPANVEIMKGYLLDLTKQLGIAVET